MKLKNMIKILLGLLISLIILVIIKYIKLFDMVSTILNVLIPVFVGYVYAWLVNPLLNKVKNRHCISIGLFLFIVVMLFLFLYYLVPLVYKEVNELVKMLPRLFEYFEPRLYQYGINLNEYEFDINRFVEYIPSLIIKFFKNTFKYVGAVFVGLVIGLYMSMEFNKINSFILSIVPKKYKCEIIHLINKVNKETRKCIIGMFIVSFFIFFLDTIVFYVLKLNSPFLLGVLCGITDLIPYIGPYIGGLVVLLVSLSEGRNVVIITLISLFIIQCIENYVLQPIIMSKSIKVSPIFILIGLLVFGKLFGVFGMILATPVVAMLKVIIKNIKPLLIKYQKSRT